MKRVLLPALLLFLTGLARPLWAQQVQLQLGPEEIAENQAWTITVSVINGQLKSYSAFPDIEGMRKRGTSTQSQMNSINGQVTSSQSVVMTYVPMAQGVVSVPAFTMKVNDQTVNAPAKKIKVGPPVTTQAVDPFRSPFDTRDPFREYFGRSETEFIDVKEDALLALTTSKDEVYVGEGFTATLSFLVADNNRAPMQFFELGRQLSEMLKKLKPSNCWEENFNIENIESEQVTINGKGYSQYRIYQATFYPLNTEPVIFPSVGLKMIKFKVAKNPSFFGQNRQEDYKTFVSREKQVRVKELPPHPLQRSVAVGSYRLDEHIGSTHLQTGQSVAYEFNVYGEGNISSVEKPAVPTDPNFDIYEPNVQQNIARENGKVAGTKSFKYFVVPKEPGDFALKNYFQWIYFDPAQKKYDTLRSEIVVHVEGESHQNQAIQSLHTGSFYEGIDSADNNLRALSQTVWLRRGTNLLILLLLAGGLYMMFRKPA